VTTPPLGRVLQPGGKSPVQMANKFGVRNFVQQARRGFTTPKLFEVRYWYPAEMLRALEHGIGPARTDVDSDFALDTQAADLEAIPRRYRPLVRAPECRRVASRRQRSLLSLADSLYVHATRASA
jgi:hypothetical protein